MEWYKDGLYPEWHIRGENFSPLKLQRLFPELNIKCYHEKSDIAKKGRYENRDYRYGSCKIVVDKGIQLKLDWLLDFILEHQVVIRNLGVDDELLWIFWYGTQGNMELSSEHIIKIGNTGNPLNMNYHYIEEE